MMKMQMRHSQELSCRCLLGCLLSPVFLVQVLHLEGDEELSGPQEEQGVSLFKQQKSIRII